MRLVTYMAKTLTLIPENLRQKLCREEIGEINLVHATQYPSIPISPSRFYISSHASHVFWGEKAGKNVRMVMTLTAIDIYI